MDVTGVLTGLAEKGWRIGLPFAIGGGLILFAHQHRWPEPDILKPWLGFATVAGALGVAVTGVAALTAFLSWIKESVRSARYDAERKRQQLARFESIKKEMYERIDLLPPFQQMKLAELLVNCQGSTFAIRDADGPAQSLLETGFFELGDRVHYGSICKIHPVLLHERQNVIDRLNRK